MDRIHRMRAIMADIADLKVALKEAEDERNALMAEMMMDGIADIGDGYRIIRSEKYDLDIEKARELVPVIYDNMIRKLEEDLEVKPTKSDLEKAIAHLPTEQREAVMQHIRDGEPTVSYSIRRTKA